MAEIFQFRKKDAAPPHHREGDIIAPNIRVPESSLEVFLDSREDVIGDWQSAAVKNRLNEYFFSKIPHHARGEKDADYVNSIDQLSAIERKLDIVVASFYPGATPNNLYGFLAAFTFMGEIYTTSPDIMSEANARAMNILQYLSFTKQLTVLGWV